MSAIFDQNPRPSDPSDTDDPLDPIEENDPEGAITPKDPEGTLVDPLDPDTGPRDPISEPDEPHPSRT
ncbi:MAG: hypothetical protein V4628_15035 [Pseudomonadota bacterium]